MLSDKIMNIAVWTGLPLVMKARDKEKKLRVAAWVVSMTLLLPLAVLTPIIFMIGFFVFMYEEI